MSVANKVYGEGVPPSDNDDQTHGTSVQVGNWAGLHAMFLAPDGALAPMSRFHADGNAAEVIRT